MRSSLELWTCDTEARVLPESLRFCQGNCRIDREGGNAPFPHPSDWDGMAVLQSVNQSPRTEWCRARWEWGRNSDGNDFHEIRGTYIGPFAFRGSRISLFRGSSRNQQVPTKIPSSYSNSFCDVRWFKPAVEIQIRRLAEKQWVRDRLLPLPV